MDIIKASGEKEKFKEEKLYRSLRRAGSNQKLAEKISGKVAKRIYSGIDSEKILEETIGYLKEDSPLLAARYNLKKAIMELGPAGYSFEKFIARIFEEYGYYAETGKMVKGYCVAHEVDVVARKRDRRFMVECKYHNKRGIRSDVKTALYVYARFLDIKKACEKLKGEKNLFHQAWLVTNTRCTSRAARYAKCVGLKIISWKYPKNESLEFLIENKGLYPITVLPSLTKFAKERLIEKKIILTKDLLRYSDNKLAQITGIHQEISKKLLAEAKGIY